MYKDTKDLLSETKFYEGYSRYDDEKKRYETWEEAVSRVMDMHRGFYADKFTPELEAYVSEAQAAYNEKLVLGAQRALQFGGDQLLKHPMKMYNCTSSYADRPAFFGEVFYILLCGAGAGFSVQTHHVDKLPKISPRNKSPKIHVVEDSIEGWATALDVLMSSFFEDGGKYPDFINRRVFFDLTQIRPKGAKISGGFKAPGPEPLRRALDNIEFILTGLTIKDKLAPLRPIHVYDIVMHAADAVLAGGVRRSATICLFSPTDDEMMNAKTGAWWSENPQRGRSNNSAVIVRKEIQREQFAKLMESIKQFGEPGFVFVESTEHTTNPCVEIGMYPQIDGKSGWQGCNLTEINGGKCEKEEIFYRACRAASILGTLQAGYTDFSFLDSVSKKIFDREALLGVSITGWMNNPEILFDEAVLQKGAEIVKQVNAEVSKLISINQAARTTCVKPSGNASVLLMTASGIHAEHSPMYIRNIQLNKDTEIAQTIRKINPDMVEESAWSVGKTDFVVSFPIISKTGSLTKDSMIGINHLDLIKKAQANWVNTGTNVELCADPGIRHNVSNTVIVRDWDEIEEYVFNNRNFFAGISFLSETGDKDYYQAPNTEVLNSKEIIKRYGTGSLFASGVIVESLKTFSNLWIACNTAQGYGEDVSADNHENALKKEWIRRFKKFAENYFKGDLKKTEYCLKDVYLLHKWEKIQKTFINIKWKDELKEIRYIDVDTMGAAACVGTKDGEGCLI
jgi:ribonucleoside-diphosphate reductase alpha chain